MLSQSHIKSTWIPLIFLLSLLFKIPFLGAKLFGHFGSYQSLNAMMASVMIQNGWQGIVIPQTYLLMDGALARHLLYFPFASLTAAAFQIIWPMNLDFYGRFQASLYLTLANWLYVKILQRRAVEPKIQIWSIMFFFLSPCTLIAGLSFQNEACGLFFLLTAYWILLRWRNSYDVAGSGLLLGLTLVARLHYALILLLFIPELIRLKARRKILFFLCLFAPVFLWLTTYYKIEMQAPNAVMTSLFKQAGENRILTWHYFLSISTVLRYIKILSFDLVTPIGAWCVFLVFLRRIKIPAFWIYWAALLPLTLLLFPRKVADHPFYLLFTLPGLCVLAGAGFEHYIKNHSFVVTGLLLLIFIGFSLRSYIPPAFSGYTQEAQRIASIGKWIDSTTSPNDRIIAEQAISPELLYQTQRYGWSFDLGPVPSSEADSETRSQSVLQQIETLKLQGARYLLISHPSELETLSSLYDFLNHRYPVTVNTKNQALLYDLARSKDLTVAFQES